MSTHQVLAVSSATLGNLCRRHHIKRLSLFGSVLRDDFRPDSDVDVLVEFEPDHVPGLITLGSIEDELSQLFGGRAVDLHTPGSLSAHFRAQVLAEAEVQFEHRKG